MTITNGFGMTITFESTPSARHWYLDENSMQRWVDNDQPCNGHPGFVQINAPGGQAESTDDLAKRLKKPKCSVDGVLYGGLALCRHVSFGSYTKCCKGALCEHQREAE